MRPFVTTAAQEVDSQISPDGQWVSFISTSGGGSQVMVQRVDGGEPRPLTLGQGTPVSQIWSPDGKQLACVLTANGEWLLQIYPAFFGGAPQQTVSLEAGRATDAIKFQGVELLRWIDHTLYLNIRAPEPSLQRIDLAAPAGGVANLSAGWKLAGPIRSVDVRPDGGAVALTLFVSGQDDVWIANLDGSAAHALTQDAFFERNLLWNGRGDRIIFQSNRGGQVDLWQIDPRTKAVTQLTSGETENTPESTSADGSLISFARLSQDAKLWLLGPVDPAGRQLTQDALSDYSPVVSGDGRTVVFQRSQPSPSRGTALVDATLLVAPLRDNAITTDVRPIADGFAATLSFDGAWAAYLQPSGVPQRAVLYARDLVSGTTIALSRNAAIPISSTVPVDWASTTMAWRQSEAGSDLFFVDQSDVSTIRRYHTGDAAPGPPIAKSSGPTDFLRDLYLSPDGARLAYVAVSPGAFAIHVIDLSTSVDRLVKRLVPALQGVGTSALLRGWVDNSLVVVERTKLNEDKTGDVDVRIVSAASGETVTAGTITGAFAATSRLHVARRVLYITRIENGVHNLYEFPLAGGPLKPLTRNGLPGVTFSGFYPVGPDALIGVRDERRQDIWLIQESSTKRTGNPAGR
jgi:Tol biopolymer transport system component